MKVIDLTHTISEDMPVYPGTEGPKLKAATSYEDNGFKETLLSMYSHTGTHMDPPAHLYSTGMTLENFEASQFVGKAIVVDCTSLKEGDRITMDMIDREAADEADYLLFHTGWDKYWGSEKYFVAYPYVTEEVVDYLSSSGKKGVGLDTIGLDPVPDLGLTLHRRLFQNDNIVIIENLANLGKLPKGQFLFCCLPLKYQNADGSPIRAIAILDEEF